MFELQAQWNTSLDLQLPASGRTKKTLLGVVHSPATKLIVDQRVAEARENFRLQLSRFS